MLVHNYYSDMMSTLYTFLNNDVLSGHNKVRSIHYNIEDASSILEYNDFSKLPSMVINYTALDDSSISTLHPRTFQFMSNITDIRLDQVLVLSNFTKGLNFYVQLRPFLLNVEVSVKCGSQLQALNIKHDILNVMPANRQFNHKSTEFVSFFEIDNSFLLPSINDVVNDDISNLFLRQDGFGKIGRMFSIPFSPLIRMSGSPTVTLDDKAAGSYLVTFPLELSIYEPFSFITDDSNLRKDLQVGITSTSSIATINRGPVEVPVYNKNVYIIVTLLDGTKKLYAFDPSSFPKYTDVDGTIINANFIGIGTIFEFEGGTGVMFKYASGLTLVRLSDGRTITNAVLDPIANTLTGLLIDGTSITLDLFWFEDTPVITDVVVISSPPISVFKIVSINDIYSVADKIPPFRTTLNLATSIITGIKVINVLTKVITTVSGLIVPFLPNGDFSTTLGGIPTDIFGHLNKLTAQFETLKSSDLNYNVYSITMLPIFDFQRYGLNIIESISMDINETVSSTFTISNFYDKTIGGVIDFNIDFLTVITSVVTTTSTNTFYKFQFTVIIDPTTFVLDPSQNPLTFSPSFRFNGEIADGYILVPDSSSPTFLNFQVTEHFKLLVLDNVSGSNPLYFGISKIKP